MISKAPRPWIQRVVNGAVFDTKGHIVSFVDDAPFVLHAAQTYDLLVATLRHIERMAAASPSFTDQAIAAGARAALFCAEHPEQPGPRSDMPSPEKVKL